MSPEQLKARLLQPNATPLLCLDYLRYARKVFEPGQERWFDSAMLLNVYRQAQRALNAEVILLPLLDWMSAWWQAEVGMPPASDRPAKALRAACNHDGMVAALTDTLRALHTMNSAQSTVALLIDDPGRWLSWAGGDAGQYCVLDGADAEDVAVYLSALLHEVAPCGAGAIFLCQRAPLDGDAGQVYEPLTNTAAHYGLSSLYCNADGDSLPNGFDCLATSAPVAGAGRMLKDSDWLEAAPSARRAPFVFGVIPEATEPAQALATVAALRLRAT